MNREDIERMARAAKGHAYTNRYTPGETAFAFSIDRLEHFVALIISHHDKANRPKPDASEREWLQQIAYQHGGIGDLSGTEFEFGAMVAAAVRNKYEAKFNQLDALTQVWKQQPNKPCCLEEREACAKVCEQWNASHPEALAAAIRARGQT